MIDSIASLIPDILSHLHELWVKFLIGLLEPIRIFSNNTGRIAWLYLSISLIVAFGVYLFQKRQNQHQHQNFINFLQLKAVYSHPSAIIDYKFLFVGSIINSLLIVPILFFILGSTQHTLNFLNNVLGERSAVPPTILSIATFTIIIAIMYDFAKYWVHRALHAFPFLWEFHKVHHSAAVLTPISTRRGHPIETILYGTMITFIVGPIFGIYSYYYGGEVSFITILNTNTLILFTHAVSGNLRHSHIWLSYGRVTEHILSSPSQHQIHHSDDPKHYNKNFVGHFAFWDWLFGTLYTTTSKPENISFGIGKEGQHYKSIAQLLFRPFIVIYSQTRGKLQSRYK